MFFFLLNVCSSSFCFPHCRRTLFLLRLLSPSIVTLFGTRQARGNRIRPLAIAQTFQHFGAPQTQSRIAGEGNTLSDRVVKFHHRHSSTDRCPRIRARLGTYEKIHIYYWRSLGPQIKLNSHFGSTPDQRPLSWHAIIGWPCIIYSGLQLN